MAALSTESDREAARRLFTLHDSAAGAAYYWFGQIPNGAIFFHPQGLRYSPMSVYIDTTGALSGKGTWRRYPQIREHEGFAEFARFVGLDHRGVASGFPIDEFDVDELWAIAVRCAQRVNGANDCQTT
ncbi:hypothetical protein [Mycolicibacterium arseniciresistens]|uniref:YdhG-like domain-containing protein n=1 Tax=Mycolicibacterium arseniciresistens TaxID=3062257 RepID=A0ABT8UC69_9MYCO|nr:hypothetical protein [Mycolicibacterium arseniciresistens]MDO3634450.1 hypothetical protein [Mycolicibacterium arseniciresistens]